MAEEKSPEPLHSPIGGDPCPACATGRLYVYCTKQMSEVSVRYYRCRICGHRPAENKVIVPRRFRIRRLRR